MIIDGWNEQALAYFKENDPLLYQNIQRTGPISRLGIEDPFQAMVFQIISQQISTKAANSIQARLEKLVNKVDAQTILSLSREQLQQIGISFRKVDYIQGLAKAVESQEINFNELKQLSNQEIINQLTKLAGIGVWSVEMLLLHTFGRMDVISYGDLMIRKGMEKLYGYDKINKKQFNEHAKIYKGYGSIASLYLWHLSKE